MSQELKDALELAFDSSQTKEEEEEEVKDDKETSEDKSDKKSDDETSEDDDDDADDEEDTAETDEKAKAALQLYELLNDPKTAGKVLSKIAEGAGYELKTLSKGQRSAVLSEIEESLEEILGDQASLLPNNFGAALEKIIDTQNKGLQAKVEALEARLNLEAQKKHESAVDEAMKWAEQEFSDFNDPVMMKRMFREMKALQPAPGSDVKAYIQKMYRLAGGKAATSSTERNARTKQNLDGRKPSDDVRKARSTKPVESLADAINKAWAEQYPDEE